MEESKVSVEGDSHQIDTSEPETGKPSKETTKVDVMEPHKIDEDTSVAKRDEDPEKNSDNEDNSQDEDPEKEEEETKVPLMPDDSGDINVKVDDEDTLTLPISEKNKKDEEIHKSMHILLII